MCSTYADVELKSDSTFVLSGRGFICHVTSFPFLPLPIARTNWSCNGCSSIRWFLGLQLIAKASKDPGRTGLRVLDLACGKGGDLGKWAAHPDGVELYVGSDIAFGSLEHLIERMASKCADSITLLSLPSALSFQIPSPLILFLCPLCLRSLARISRKGWQGQVAQYPGEAI